MSHKRNPTPLRRGAEKRNLDLTLLQILRIPHRTLPRPRPNGLLKIRQTHQGGMEARVHLDITTESDLQEGRLVGAEEAAQ